jgi:transposase-like protein
MTSVGKCAPLKLIAIVSPPHDALLAMEGDPTANGLKCKFATKLRAVKRITRPMLGFKSFDAAQATLVGIELMHMLRKGQLADGVEQELTAAEQFYSLAA